MEGSKSTYTAKELSKKFNIGKRQVYKWIKKEGLAVKIGGSYRVPKESLKKWFNDQLDYEIDSLD